MSNLFWIPNINNDHLGFISPSFFVFVHQRFHVCISDVFQVIHPLPTTAATATQESLGGCCCCCCCSRYAQPNSVRRREEEASSATTTARQGRE
jgi:hypothetical protein